MPPIYIPTTMALPELAAVDPLRFLGDPTRQLIGHTNIGLPVTLLQACEVRRLDIVAPIFRRPEALLHSAQSQAVPKTEANASIILDIISRYATLAIGSKSCDLDTQHLLIAGLAGPGGGGILSSIPPLECSINLDLAR